MGKSTGAALFHGQGKRCCIGEKAVFLVMKKKRGGLAFLQEGSSALRELDFLRFPTLEAQRSAFSAPPVWEKRGRRLCFAERLSLRFFPSSLFVGVGWRGGALSALSACGRIRVQLLKHANARLESFATRASCVCVGENFRNRVLAFFSFPPLWTRAALCFSDSLRLRETWAVS